MVISLSENTHPHLEWGNVNHREWRCTSPGVHNLTGNGNATHR